MKPTSETAAFLKILNQYEDWQHIGNELASTVNEHQARNFRLLVAGYEEIRIILHED